MGVKWNLGVSRELQGEFPIWFQTRGCISIIEKQVDKDILQGVQVCTLRNTRAIIIATGT